MPVGYLESKRVPTAVGLTQANYALWIGWMGLQMGRRVKNPSPLQDQLVTDWLLKCNQGRDKMRADQSETSLHSSSPTSVTVNRIFTALHAPRTSFGLQTPSLALVSLAQSIFNLSLLWCYWIIISTTWSTILNIIIYKKRMMWYNIFLSEEVHKL